MKKSKSVFMVSVFTVLSMIVMGSLSYGIDVIKQPVMPKEGINAPLTDKAIQQGIIIINDKIIRIDDRTIYVNDSKGRMITFDVNDVGNIKIGDTISFDERITTWCIGLCDKTIRIGNTIINVNKVMVN